MSLIFARLGRRDYRASQIVQQPRGCRGGRRNWVCAECKARATLGSRRGYGDNNFRRSVDGAPPSAVSKSGAEPSTRKRQATQVPDLNGTSPDHQIHQAPTADAARESCRPQREPDAVISSHVPIVQRTPERVDLSDDEELERAALWARFEAVGDEDLEHLEAEIYSGGYDLKSAATDDRSNKNTLWAEFEVAEDEELQQAGAEETGTGQITEAEASEEEYGVPEEEDIGESIPMIDARDEESRSQSAGFNNECKPRKLRKMGLLHASNLDVDYKTQLLEGLSRGEADLVTRCLLAAERVNDLDFLRSMSAQTFSDIIRLLQPRNFFTKLASTHVELSALSVEHIGATPIAQIARDYSYVLGKVILLRSSSRNDLTFDDYVILLRSASDLGNRVMAMRIWDRFIGQHHVPTTECYKYFMSAVVWNGRHNADLRHKVRNTPYITKLRQRGSHSDEDSPGNTSGHRGVRESAMKIFNEMLAKGLIADEDTFRLLVTACAREGDIKTAKAVLLTVWYIDVDGIVDGKDEASMMPRAIPENSPLRPTVGLLFTIAHAFGINNDVPAALRTVDFVARHYSLPIPEHVWAQLFEWTFVMCCPRTGRFKAELNVGQLPKTSAMNLWHTMTGDPYFVKPTLGMYNYLIKNLYYRAHAPLMIEKMHEAIPLLVKDRVAESKAWQQLLLNIGLKERGLPHASLENLRNTWEYLDLIRQRGNFWARRWMRLLLGSWYHFHQVDIRSERYARDLPSLLWKWRAWVPKDAVYETPTGFVTIVFREEEELLQNAEEKMDIVARQQRTLDQTSKLVGHTWVRGAQRKEPRRLKDNRVAARQRIREYPRGAASSESGRRTLMMRPYENHTYESLQ